MEGTIIQVTARGIVVRCGARDIRINVGMGARFYSKGQRVYLQELANGWFAWFVFERFRLETLDAQLERNRSLPNANKEEP